MEKLLATLSFAVVPLVVFYLNLIGVKITTLNSTLTILGIIINPIVVLNVRIVKHKQSRRKKNI